MSASDAFCRIIKDLGRLDDPEHLNTIKSIIDNRIRTISPERVPARVPVRNFAQRRSVPIRSAIGGGASKYHRPRQPRKPDNQKGCQYGKRCTRQNDKSNPCTYNHDIVFKTTLRCRNGDTCKFVHCPYRHAPGWSPSSDADSESDSSSDEAFIISTPVKSTEEPKKPTDETLDVKVEVNEDGSANWGE
jgi:hypothetical protein